MTDRDALLDLQARWAAVGFHSELFHDFGTDFLAFSPMGKVLRRERWQIGTMPPEALRVFADWIEEGEAK